jgi:general secretion pathway protein G
MEMLIVLGILVIVFALAAPRFFGAREKANLNATKVQIEAFRGALDKYKFDTMNYPATEQGLQALFQAPAGSEDEEGGEVSGWDGPYMNKPALPKDPWGNEYQYAYPPERGSGDFPDIWSLGPDGEDNTEDDICSWVTSSEEGEEGELGGAEPGRGRDRESGAPPRKVDVGDVSVGGEDSF